MSIYRRIQIRRDTAQRWASVNPALREGELGLVLLGQDTENTGEGVRLKAGDGFTSWNDLPYLDETSLQQIKNEYGDEVSFEIGLSTTIN